MLKQTEIQDALKKAFPEFYNKSQLINYYCSFDFPEKQMKMVSWWLKVVEFIIEHENKVFITYQQLVTYLTIYNLKPTPVPAILNYLAQQQKLGPANQYQVREELKEDQQQGKSFFGSVMSYFSKPATKEVIFFKCQGNEKIFSRKIKEFKKQQIKKELHHMFTQHFKSMNQIKLVEQLEKKVKLDRQSILELLSQLDQEGAIKMMHHGQRTFVLYSHTTNDLNNQEWCEVQRMKFCLREQIDKFEYMINEEEQKILKLRQRVKEHIANGNKNSGHALCKEIKEKEKKITNIVTRKNIMDNQITQLEYNEMNKSTVTLLEEANKIYEQTQIDPNKLEQIVQKNMEIEISNKQTNQKLEDLVGHEDYEEDVDQMMKQLQQEALRKPQKISVHVNQKMDIQTINGQKVNQSEKMNVESINGRKVEQNYN